MKTTRQDALSYLAESEYYALGTSKELFSNFIESQSPLNAANLLAHVAECDGGSEEFVETMRNVAAAMEGTKPCEYCHKFSVLSQIPGDLNSAFYCAECTIQASLE